MQCQAKSKSTGEQCKNEAMAGKRVCRIHGGLTPGGAASPHFRHGRYSKYLPEGLADRYQVAINDPDLLNLSSDIALVQAHLTELVEQVSRYPSGPPQWHRVRELIKEIKDANRIDDLNLRGKLFAETFADLERYVASGNFYFTLWDEIKETEIHLARLMREERSRRKDLQQYVTAEQALAYAHALVAAVRKYVTDPDTLARIQAEFIRLSASANAGSDHSQPID